MYTNPSKYYLNFSIHLINWHSSPPRRDLGFKSLLVYVCMHRYVFRWIHRWIGKRDEALDCNATWVELKKHNSGPFVAQYYYINLTSS